MFVSRPSKNTTLAEVQQHVVLMSKGIVEDPRDTDNSWVERMSLCMHADEDVFPTLPADAQLCWVQVSRELDLPSSEVELLQEVAVAYGAYYADQVRSLAVRDKGATTMVESSRRVNCVFFFNSALDSQAASDAATDY